MRSFTCGVCGRLLVFENSVCLSCGTPQGFDPVPLRLVPVPQDGSLLPCANLDLAGCNWLVPADEVDAHARLCRVCRLTRTRPADGDADGLAAFARTEAAKRRLTYQLIDLGLPVVAKADDEQRGLAFDLLSSAASSVVTGHADGVVTIDLAEGQDAHREAMRVELDEPYRTLLGHVRHETGHYYWEVLVEGNGLLDPGSTLERFRALFGDERADYAAALRRHYGQGPDLGWGERYVSAYATAHPWEDWAETFAHYLHICDTLQTAAAYGMTVTGPEGSDRPDESLAEQSDIETIVATWLPLTYALNAVNRSMGKDDVYPFLLAPAVIEKLGFVHHVVQFQR